MSPSEIQQALVMARQDLRFNEGEHTYEVLFGEEWRPMPSVTTVTGTLNKEGLVPWAAKVQSDADAEAVQTAINHGADPVAALDGVKHAWKNIKKDAADLGTEVHALCEHHVRKLLGVDTKMPPVSEEARFVFRGFESWAESVSLEPVASEAKVFSRRHEYAGTFDLLGFVNGALTLVDFKSSKAIYREMHLQIFAYQQAVAELTGGQQTRGMIVHLPKQASKRARIKAIACDDTPDGAGFRAFLGLRETYRWMRAA